MKISKNCLNNLKVDEFILLDYLTDNEYTL